MLFVWNWVSSNEYELTSSRGSNKPPYRHRLRPYESLTKFRMLLVLRATCRFLWCYLWRRNSQQSWNAVGAERGTGSSGVEYGPGANGRGAQLALLQRWGDPAAAQARRPDDLVGARSSRVCRRCTALCL